jgi:phage major head subunit gpT-like protein
MEITSESLNDLRAGFKTTFQGGLSQAKPQWDRVAMEVPSSTIENKYGWLKQIPGMSEWVGPRTIHNLSEGSYAIPNKDFELTVGVSANNIRDDNLGIYTPMFSEMGRASGAHPDLLVFGLLKAGFGTLCFDGQNFFDTDHPVIGADGTVASVSNSGGGAGTPWFLLDTTRIIKPLINQTRQAPQFVAKDDPRDERVFMNKEFVYGVDERRNVGFGFWQMAYGSKSTLDGGAYATARAAIGSFKGDHGRPLGLTPNLLVVPPSLESAGRKILNSENASGGETNEWKGTAELLVVPWLA